MRIIRTIGRLRSVVNEARLKGLTIGFVPTMGYLHEGHLSLMRQAKKDNDLCIVSIYVNPTQFGPKEDFKKYPRDIKRDSTMMKKENVDILFVPSDNDIYPNGYLTYIDVEQISTRLCGHFRPGHFKGVATIVLKLLNMVQPDRMYLGQKDAQQVVIIKKMVSDLNFPVDVKVVGTKREDDGLAMSSRNQYLSNTHRQEAAVLYRSLQLAKRMIEQKERSASKIVAAMRSLIKSCSSGKVQYVECVNAQTLERLKRLQGDVLIALAVFFGKTRLIDNIIIRPHEPK